ncbi:glucokinase [Aestuariivivens sediminis]|uniref:glucokinase n=1 Tax=Aestuariivivens sediminis TaxID=2913557 RepID=UPI001F569ADC|nr:glucokinase [Aestuariivivens sediminis]
MERKTKETYLYNKPLFPIYFRRRNTIIHKDCIVLAADVGGTKTNLALFQVSKGMLISLNERLYATKEYNSLLEIFNHFKNDIPIKIDCVCLGVAGPVINGKAQGTNFPWLIDWEEISKELQISSVSIINDMEANAYGLAVLRKKELGVIFKGNNIAGNATIISPGTGLGEVGLYWDGTHYHPFASEGGHCDFSPRNELEMDLWKYLHKKYNHVSWERVISGPGIYDIYKFLIMHKRESVPEDIEQKMLSENPSVLITKLAMERKDPICIETLNLFTKFLAAESAQLALKMNAIGGIFIGGGIVPKIIKGIDKTIFKTNFIQSGRLNKLLEMVPVKAILNEKTPLLGAACYGAMSYYN